jgi:hypothetical protein
MPNKKYEVIIYYLYRDGEKDWCDYTIIAKSISEAFDKAKLKRLWIYEMEIVSENDEKFKKPISWKQWKSEQHIPEKI